MTGATDVKPSDAAAGRAISDLLCCDVHESSLAAADVLFENITNAEFVADYAECEAGDGPLVNDFIATLKAP